MIQRVSSKKSLLSFWRPVYLLIIIWIVFFLPLLLGKKVLYCCDNLLITIPNKAFFVREMMAGRFPLWNPYIFSGTPFLADINLGILYPSTFLFFFLNPFLALTIGAYLHLLIGALGAYAFSRCLNISKYGAVLSGIVFGFSGVLTTYLNNTSILQPAALVPWIFLAGYYFITKKGATPIFLILVSVLQIISGHPQITFYTWLLLLPFMLFSGRGSLCDKLKKLIFPIGMIAFISAVQTLPFICLAYSSARMKLGWVYATSGSLNPLKLIRLIVPAIAGNINMGTVLMEGGSVFGYIGIVPFILLMFIPKNGKRIAYCMGVAIVSFLFALGSYTPLYWFAYTFIPGIALFRTPSQMLLFYTLSMGILAGMGLDGLLSVRNKGILVKKYINILLILCSFSLVALFLFFQHQVWIMSKIIPHIPMLQKKYTFIKPNGLAYVARMVLANILLITATVFITRVCMKKTVRQALVVALFTILLLDYYVYVRSTIQVTPIGVVNGWINESRSIISPLSNIDWRNYRTFVDKSIYSAERKKIFLIGNEDEESKWQLQIMRPNLGMLYGIPAIDGYSSVVSRDYQTYFSSNVSDPTAIAVNNISSLDQSGVNNIIANSNAVYATNPQYKKIVSNGDIAIFYNEKATARFSLKEGETNVPVSIIFSLPNKVKVQYHAIHDGRMIIMDTYDTGWNAYVDDKKTKISKYEFGKSIFAPKGDHTVTLYYQPISVYIGMILTLVGAAIAIIFTVIKKNTNK